MTVLITGATKGMGRSIAEIFAKNNHTVVACSRTEADLQSMQANFANFPGSLHTHTVDVGKPGDIANLVTWLQQSQLNIHVLINNAGFFVPGAIHSETEETMQKMLDVNLLGPYRLTKALLPKMMEQKHGHIFNVCSVASFTPMASVGSYGISKYALYGFTKNLREEMKPFNIKVTAISPGSTFTSSWQGSGVDPDKLVAGSDIAALVFAASQLSAGANTDDIIIKPLNE